MEIGQALRIQNKTPGGIFVLMQDPAAAPEAGESPADTIDVFRGSDPGLNRQIEEAEHDFQGARCLKAKLEKNTHILLGSECAFGLGTAILSSIFKPPGAVFIAAAAVYIVGIPAIFLCLSKSDKLKSELREKEALVKDLHQRQNQREEVAAMARTAKNSESGDLPAIEQIDEGYIEIDGVRLKTHQKIGIPAPSLQPHGEYDIIDESCDRAF